MEAVSLGPDQAQERQQPVTGAGGLTHWARSLEPAAAGASQILCPAVLRRRPQLQCCWPPARVSGHDQVLQTAYYCTVRSPRGSDSGAAPLRHGQGGGANQSHLATFSNRAQFPRAAGPAPRRRAKPPPGWQIYWSWGASRALAAAGARAVVSQSCTALDGTLSHLRASFRWFPQTVAASVGRRPPSGNVTPGRQIY